MVIAIDSAVNMSNINTLIGVLNAVEKFVLLLLLLFLRKIGTLLLSFSNNIGRIELKTKRVQMLQFIPSKASNLI